MEFLDFLSWTVAAFLTNELKIMHLCLCVCGGGPAYKHPHLCCYENPPPPEGLETSNIRIGISVLTGFQQMDLSGCEVGLLIFDFDFHIVVHF